MKVLVKPKDEKKILSPAQKEAKSKEVCKAVGAHVNYCVESRCDCPVKPPPK